MAVSTFPAIPIDGQVFVDSEFVRWVYNADNDLWERGGTVDAIPLATSSQDGYISRQHKKALDSVPIAGGSFGIIVDPKSILRTSDNPDGVIQGSIELHSDSLDIICVDSRKRAMSSSVVTSSSMTRSSCCNINSFKNSFYAQPGDNSQQPPGILFKPKEVFWDTLVVDLSGPTGKQGYDGDKGPQGQHGFSEGPRGIKGRPGKDIDELCKLTGVTFKDVPGIAEVALVDVKITDNDGHGCKLIATKAKLDIPDGRPADKLLVTPLSRSLIYPADPDTATCDLTRLDNWRLVQPRGDETPLNMQLLRLAKGSNDRDGEAVGFNGTMTLNTFVTEIVAEYKSRLTKLDEAWGKQVKQFIEGIDDKARGILSDLADELARCEFNLPAIDYCITFSSPSAAAASSYSVANAAGQKAPTFNMGSKSWRTRP